MLSVESLYIYIFCLSAGLITSVILAIMFYCLWQKSLTTNVILEDIQKSSEVLSCNLYLYSCEDGHFINLCTLKPFAHKYNEVNKLIAEGENFTKFVRLQDNYKYIKGNIFDGNAYMAIVSLPINLFDEYDILNKVPILIWMVNGKGELLYFNKYYKDKIGDRLVFSSADIIKGEAEIKIAGKQVSLSIKRHFMGDDRYLYLAIDNGSTQDLKKRLNNILASRNESLNFVPIAISIFDANKKLSFCNQAFMQLFELEQSFIDSFPTHNELLDKLRAKGKLSPLPNWHEWREELFQAYSKLDIQQHEWHLSDGKTLNIIAHPQPEGGVCWIYENLTPLIDLKLRYNSLIERQGDSLDGLLEGVASFSDDGKIVLSNPAFIQLWGMDVDYGVQGTHITKLVEEYTKFVAESSLPTLQEFPNLIAGFHEERIVHRGQLELKDGRFLEYVICPIRHGQTMLNYLDITAKVLMQKALAERNEALLISDELRNEFVRHVSYELLTPLTTIAGFTQLLHMSEDAHLSNKGKEYLKDIASEVNSLNNMIQDMIDLAGLNAGTIHLEHNALDINEVCREAFEHNINKLKANNIGCNLDLPSERVEFYGDKKWLEKLLINVLAYCALHTHHNQQIDLSLKIVEKNINITFASCGLFLDDKIQNPINIELPLAQSICKLCGGSLEFSKDAIICILPIYMNE